MMKGAEQHSQHGAHSTSHQMGATTSPTLMHNDLSGAIASNSQFRYDDSVAQQKARNTAYQQHLASQKRAIGQFSHSGEADGLNFENSLRQSELQDTTSLHDAKGNLRHEHSVNYNAKAGSPSDEEGAQMLIRPDEEQHENIQEHGEGEYGDSSGEDVDDDVDDDDENCIEIDERTLVSIIKVQALIRGFLTRKTIFEHLQRMVQ